MRVNIRIILAALLALLAITRYLQHQQDTQRSVAMIRPPRSANGEESDYLGAATEAPETLGDGKLGRRESSELPV